MKPEYDFRKGERGKFYRPNAELRLPIYLNADVQAYLGEIRDNDPLLRDGVQDRNDGVLTYDIDSVP